MSLYDAVTGPINLVNNGWNGAVDSINRQTQPYRQPSQKRVTPPDTDVDRTYWEWFKSFFPTWTQIQTYITLFFHIALAIACVLIAIVNRADGGGMSTLGQSTPLFHRIIVTDFEEPDSFAARVQCPGVFGMQTDELVGVDSVCTCLQQDINREMTIDKNFTKTVGYTEKVLRECRDLTGAMPAYALRYAGTVATTDFVFWAFLCITASCVTSFTRMDAYPNHRRYSRGILPIACICLNVVVVVHNWIVWTLDFDAFESTKNNQNRKDNPDTCSTIRFIFAFNFVTIFFHIPHWLCQISIFECFQYPRQFIQVKEDELVTRESNVVDFVEYFKAKRDWNPVPQDDPSVPEQTFDNFFDNPKSNKRTDTMLPSEAIQDSIHSFALNERDQQFRISYWQAVSEDINFTMGCLYLAVAFSAHGGVHDDSALFMDLSCVFMIGLLQHMSHVLMLVKEYVFEDSVSVYADDIALREEDATQDGREQNVCTKIGNTRLTIHFFVLSLIVFYCNRTAPSTFQDNEVTSFFQVARFSVILGLCLCNTLYDVFFETVHVIKHMTEVAQQYQVDAELEDQPSAAKAFLEYHAQYQGPYLWRVHLVLPLMLVFGIITAVLQHYRPILKMEFAMQLF
jgi:hypothetical protein